MTIEKKSIFGKYMSLDMQKLESASGEEKDILSNIQLNAQNDHAGLFHYFTAILQIYGRI